MNLLCIPYAGTSASIYAKWRDHLGATIQLCPLDMSGHGSRIDESPCNSVQEVAQSIYEYYKEYFNGEYSLFGHSLGSLVSFELYHLLKKNKRPLPKIIFFLACRHPM